MLTDHYSRSHPFWQVSPKSGIATFRVYGLFSYLVSRVNEIHADKQIPHINAEFPGEIKKDSETKRVHKIFT